MKTSILLSVENLSSKLFGVANFSALQFATFITSNAKQSLKRLALLMILLLSGAGVMATNYYTYTDGNPRDLSKWWTNQNGTGAHPGLTSDFYNPDNVFIIQNNNTMTISVTWVVSNLTINSGSALNITSSDALSLEGNFTNHGSLSGTGSTYIFFSGNANQNIDGFTTAGVVSMAKNGGTATFQGNVNGGSLYISGTGGTLNLGAGLTHTFTGSWTRTAGTLEGGSSLLRIEGSAIGTSGTFIPGTGAVEWNGYEDQTIAAVTYNNLILSGSGIKSIASGTSVSGNLSIAPIGSGAAKASIAGGVTINTGTLTLGGTGTTSGTWGSTASSASHTNNTYFAASTGMVNVATSSCPSFTCTISGTNSICSGSSTNLKVTISGGTSPYTVIYSGGTVSNYISGSNIPVSPTSTTTYTLTSVTDATGCVHTGSSADGAATITVNEAPNITSQPTSPSPVCAAANSSTFIVAASGGGLTYQWQRGISGVYENITGSTIPDDGAVYSGYTTAELTVANAPIEMNGYTYRCVVTGICPPLVTSDGLATLTINPLPVVSCPQSFTIYLTNQLIPLTGGLPAGGVYSGTGVSSGSFSPTLAGLGAHTITYSYTDINSCSNSCTFTVTVEELPADYCNGSAYAVIEQYDHSPTVAMNGTYALGSINGTCAYLESHEYLVLDLTGGRVLPSGSTVTFRWHKTDMYNLADPVAHVDISTNVSSWTSMGDYTLTSSTIDFEQSLTLSADTRYIKLTNKNWSSALVAIDGFTYSCESCSAPLISAHPSTSPQILCLNGSATALSVTATGTGLTYQWYSNTTASNSGGSAIESATTSSYTPLTTTTGTLYYYCVISNACLPSATSNVSGAVTVDPVSVGGSIAGSATVCSGINSTVLTLSGNIGTVSKWQYKTSGDWTDVDNKTLTLTATDLTATTEYRAVVTSGVCSSANSATATVTVDPVSVGGSIAGSATVCSGTNSTVLTLSGNTGTVSKWQYKTSGDWTDVDNKTLTLTATDLTATTEYRAVVTSGVCSSANSATATVTVDPVSVGGTIAGSAIVCSGTNSTVLTLSGNTGIVSKWQYNNGGGWTDVDNTTLTLTATDLTATTEYRAIVTSGVCSSANSATATVTVESTPIAGALTKAPDLATVCEGTQVSATLTAGSGGNGNDELVYSTKSGTTWEDWTTYNSGTAISTFGKTAVEIRTRRMAEVCDPSEYNTATWEVVPQPTAPSITESPDVSNVCEGTEVSATFGSGSDEVGCSDTYYYRYDGTGDWIVYSDALPISTTGHSLVEIRAERGGCQSGCSMASNTVSWTVITAPIFTVCPGNIIQNTDANVCTAVVNYTATANGTPAPTVTYSFTGSNPPGPSSGSGTGSGATFKKGVTTVTITASNGCTPDATCSFTVTVADDQAPVIAELANIPQTADPGKCYAIVAVAPPAVADNCDQNINPISNFELITNGNFNSGVSHWRDCGNNAETNSEEYYIVPIPPVSNNHVAEIDAEKSLCQNIGGFIVGEEYILTFKATRRQNTSTPNPVGAVVTIDGSALNQVVQRTNTAFNLTTTSYTFIATQSTHKLTFTPYSNNTGTLGIVIDDISITKMRYPVGITTITWTATDEAGNGAVAKTQTVTVSDNEKPVVNLPTPEASYTADLHECNATLTFAAAPTDNCGVLSTVYSVAGTPITFPYDFPVGSTTVDVLVTDIHTNTNTGSFTVTVNDTQSPTLIPTILPPTTSFTSGGWTSNFNGINVNNTGNTYALVAPGATVNLKFNWNMYYTGSYCPGCITQHYVTLQASSLNVCNQDGASNGGKNFNFTAPATPGVYYISLASSWWYSCNQFFTMYGPNAADNALGYIVVGTNTACPLSIVKNTDPGLCTATISKGIDAVPLDNCGTPSLTYTMEGATNASGTGSLSTYTFNNGVTTVSYLVTDNNSNSYNCSFTVTVNDNQAPVVPNNGNTTVQCVAAATAPEIPVATDNCDVTVNGVLVSITDNPNPLTCQGTRIYKYSYTDAATNVSYWTFTYNIVRTTPPAEAGTPVAISASVECIAAAVAPALPVVKDVCGVILEAPQPAISDNFDQLTCSGTREYKYTYADCKGLNFEWVFTYTIEDKTPPTVLTKPVTVTLDMNGNASITVAAVNDGTTDNCDGTLDYSLSQSTFTCADVPNKTVTLSATDCAKNTGTNTAVVTVNQRATKLVINTLILTGEYSDPVSLKATLTDFATGTKLAGKTVNFQIGTQTATGTTDANGIATASITLSQAPGVYTLSVSYTGACPYLASSATKPFLILQERACATYTGVLTASTGSVNSTKATLLLSATIVAASDGNSGDIRNALVSFLANGVLIKQLPVGLVTQGNTAVGSAATEYTYDLGTQQGATVTIAVWISGYYRNMLSLDCFDITEVTISKPGTDFITGGGYLLLEPGKHAGTIKADDNSKNNFGFNVKYNKKGTNLQGNINTIVRKTQSDYNADLNVYENVVHKIQIKGTALTSLAISKGINAEFTGKAVAQDVTDPTNVVSLGGNLVMKVLMTDNGEPGSKDLLSMTVFDKDGGVLFSSRWENNQPTKQLLAAGNLQVNPSGLKAAEITTDVTPIYADEPTLKVYPNPFNERLRFEFVSPINTEALLDIFDATGRKVKTIFVGQVEGGVLNSAEFIPATSVTGLYIYRLTMDKKVFVGKVIYKE